MIQELGQKYLADENGKFSFSNPFMKDSSRIHISITKNEERNKDWKKESAIPFYMFVSVLSLIVTLIFIIPNVISIIRISAFRNKAFLS